MRASRLIEAVVCGKDPKVLVEDNEWALQLVDTFKSEEAANQAFEGLKLQDGYIGGRVTPPAPSKPGWHVQVFFIDEPEATGVLPDGMRRVILPAGQKKMLGIGESLEEGKVWDALGSLWDELAKDPATWGTATKSGLKSMGLAHLSQMGNWQLTKFGKVAQQMGKGDFLEAVEAAIGVHDHLVDMMELSNSEYDKLSSLGWTKRDLNGNKVLSPCGKAVVNSF